MEEKYFRFTDKRDGQRAKSSVHRAVVRNKCFVDECSHYNSRQLYKPSCNKSSVNSWNRYLLPANSLRSLYEPVSISETSKHTTSTIKNKTNSSSVHYGWWTRHDELSPWWILLHGCKGTKGVSHSLFTLPHMKSSIRFHSNINVTFY